MVWVLESTEVLSSLFWSFLLKFKLTLHEIKDFSFVDFVYVYTFTIGTYKSYNSYIYKQRRVTQEKVKSSSIPSKTKHNEILKSFLNPLSS